MSFWRKREKKIEFKSSSRSRPRIQILSLKHDCQSDAVMKTKTVELLK